jgi:hypothetical protein
VRHSPGRRDPVDRADHAACSDENAKVIPAQRHQLLDKGAVALKPALLHDVRERLSERLGVVTAVDLPSPASEPRLDDDRSHERRWGAAGPNVDGRGMSDGMTSQ